MRRTPARTEGTKRSGAVRPPHCVVDERGEVVHDLATDAYSAAARYTHDFEEINVRVYRGLKQRYRPERVTGETNFTDCPYAALQYAAGSRGVVLVVDIPDDGDPIVHSALWLRTDAMRFIVYGRFDDRLVEIIDAKLLRAELRARGLSKLSVRDAERSRTLRHILDRMLLPAGSNLRGSQ